MKRRQPQQRLAKFVRQVVWLLACALLVLPGLSGCSRQAPAGYLVLTRSPAVPSNQSDVLDQKYPPGTRVVTVDKKLEQFTLLSQGLVAAGDPQVSYDGAKVLFCGKTRPEADWQIYEVKLPHGKPHALTSIPGGAMDPLLLPDGSVAFVSPVSKPGLSNAAPSAIYVTVPNAPARRLTFSPADLSDPTLLADGRILFVSHRRCSPDDGPGAYSLVTINNDGTEITEFSSLADPRCPLQRPRQFPGGRIAFLMAQSDAASAKQELQFVRCSRPFFGSEPLLREDLARIFSFEPATEGDLLLCAVAPSTTNVVLYRVPAADPKLGKPLLADSAWNVLEAAELAVHPAPMGRLSNVDPAEKTGQLLCLNANFTHPGSLVTATRSTATHVRVLAQLPGNPVQTLGDVRLQADGSFMAEVPADLALGFETRDDKGAVLYRLEPSIWVRPGENRSCIGCHEPHNQSPHNTRPLAVRAPVPRLTLESLHVAQRKP